MVLYMLTTRCFHLLSILIRSYLQLNKILEVKIAVSQLKVCCFRPPWLKCRLNYLPLLSFDPLNYSEYSLIKGGQLPNYPFVIFQWLKI